MIRQGKSYIREKCLENEHLRGHKLKFHKNSKKSIKAEFKFAGDQGSQQESTEIDRRVCQTREVFTKASSSVRVPRAETRLTVYRSPLVRMLPQLVGLFSVERACVKLDVFFQVLEVC